MSADQQHTINGNDCAGNFERGCINDSRPGGVQSETSPFVIELKSCPTHWWPACHS